MKIYPITKTYLLFLMNNCLLILVYLALINWQNYINYNIIDPYHINNCYILVIFNYLLIFYFSYFNERYYSKQFNNQMKYSDLTMEFTKLDEKYTKEEEIINLFNNLTNNTVKEVSLVYDLSNYFKLKKDIEKEKDKNKKSKIKEKLDSHLNYFNLNKDKYFLNRGFITFNDWKSAYLFKELMNKINNKKKLIKKERKMVESSEIVGNQIKYFKNNIKNSKFRVKRGTNPELINFKYNVKKVINLKKIILFTLIILVVLPYLSYYVNNLYFKNFINYNNGYESSKKTLYTIFLIIIDQVAFFLIDWFLIPKRFLKQGVLVSYKFFFYNIYTLFTNIIIPTYSMKIAYSNFISLHNDNKIKNLLIEMWYQNYKKAVIGMIKFKTLKPLLKKLFIFIFKKNKKTAKAIESIENHTIIFSFSYISSCIMYISFFCFVTPKVSIIMIISLIILFILDFLHLKNKDFENIFPVSLFGNFWTFLIMILFPSIFIGRFIIAPIFLSNVNIWNISIMDISNLLYGYKLFKLFGLIYIFTIVIYFILYRNDKFLKRIQSKIWNNKLKNNQIGNIEIKGNSYRDVNPVYNLNN